MTRIGFIGTGHIAAPMARCLARAGHSVTVSERSQQTATALVETGLGIVTAPNQAVLDASDIVFLCLRPPVWQDVVKDLVWRADHSVVSVMAGISLGDLSLVCAPVTDLSITIPYGFIENGGCPLPVAGDPSVLTALFGAENPILPQRDEAALVDFFAASALASGVLHMLEQSSAWLADKTGDADAAEVYVANLISGVLHALPKDRAGGLEAERRALATPGTLNLQMFEGLRRDGAFDRLPALLDSIGQSMTAKT
jgi:pyrroline-5-carboxylate reductase